jgi:hypothetical protein
MNDLPTYNGMPPLTPRKPTSLTDALRSGQQCDEDGVMCIVSRQACHEAADEIEASQAKIAELEAGSVLWRRNLRGSFDAMCAMRNDINDVIQMPSLESDLLEGPETSVFCSEVAFAVIEKVKDQQARIAELEAALQWVKDDAKKSNDAPMFYRVDHALKSKP